METDKYEIKEPAKWSLLTGRERFSKSDIVQPKRWQWNAPSVRGLWHHFVQWIASGSGTSFPYIRRSTAVISA